MERDQKLPQQDPKDQPQINHINKVEEPPKDKKSEKQRLIDQQTHTQPLVDMHLESGEKINEYKV